MNPERTYLEPSDRFLGRRRLLQAGGLSGLGLGLARLPRAKTAGAAEARDAARIKSCILLFYYGGPSQLDTWDMKPAAPAEVRGEFRAAATSVPGVRLCEHLPRCGRLMHKLAVVRSLHHRMRNHNAAAVESLCGHTPLKGDLELLADDPNSFPCYGAVLSYLMPRRRGVPPHVALPHVLFNVVPLPGQNAGFLGAAHNPFQVAKDPNAPGLAADALELPAEMTPPRLEGRRSLLARLGSRAGAWGSRSGADVLTGDQGRAFELLDSARVRRAFDLSREPAAVRQRYGRDRLGQSLLLARRLVEAGVRFLNVNDKIRNGQLDNWDSHENNFGRLKNDLLPPADRAFSALIEDLDARGLLDSTLVVAVSEFGRTPKINPQAGRDHWPDCFSAVLAGGGVRGGAVYGASDRLGAYPADDPVTPSDLAATLFWAFGLDPATEVRDLTGRPYRIAEGEPLRKLFA